MTDPRTAVSGDWEYDDDGLSRVEFSGVDVQIFRHDAGGFLVMVYSAGDRTEPPAVFDVRGTVRSRPELLEP